MKKVGIHKKGEVCFDELLEVVRKNPDIRKVGGIGCFIGIVRETGLKVGKVSFLEYEAYPKIAVRQLEKIRDELIHKHRLVDLLIHHVVDHVEVGEDVLYVLAAGGHRKEVFAAVREAVDRLKKEVAIWKKEVTEKEAYWVSEQKR